MRIDGEALARAEREGREAVVLARADPRSAARLLGDFEEAWAREVLVRRLLLALRVPPRLCLLALRLPRREELAPAIQRLAFWRGARAAVGDRKAWTALTRGTAVLAYHAIGTPESRFVVSPARFARHLLLLRLAGYRAVSVRELAALRRKHVLGVPERLVVLTFDDCYAGVWDACANLERRGFRATLFAVTGMRAGRNEWDDPELELAGLPLLQGDQLRALAKRGFELGAHTVSHADLPALPPEAARAEIAGSLDALRELLGRPVMSFAYPYGRYDDVVERAAIDSGFEAICTVVGGVNTLATPLTRLRRTEARPTDSPLRFLLKARFGISD